MIDFDEVGYYAAIGCDYKDWAPHTQSCVMEYGAMKPRAEMNDLVLQNRKYGWFYGPWGKHATRITSPIFFSSRRVRR